MGRQRAGKRARVWGGSGGKGWGAKDELDLGLIARLAKKRKGAALEE
jgi:hypothetical protein